MLQILQPIWMMMTAGIIVPVVIHLWDRRPGRTLKVGSTALLRPASIRHARRPRLSEWWLLLLRCLLILLLALLLARPVWERPLRAGIHKGWVLISGSGAYHHFKKQIDSLMHSGAQLHALEEGFPEITPDELPVSTRIGYWQGIQLLQQQLPPDFRVYLFTDDRLQHFYGERPATPLRINWYAYTPEDSLSDWTAASYATGRDSGITITGNSTPRGITYTSHDSISTRMDTSLLHITIYTGDFPADARYVQAALQAVKQYTRRRLYISTFTANPPAAADWLFWLSRRPLPKGLTASHILRYDSGTVSHQTVRLLPGNIPVYQYITTADTSGMLLQNSRGAALLTTHGTPDGKRTYHFYTRFHPAWTGLVWDGSFPQLFMELMWGKMDSIPPAKDTRSMPPAQRAPAFASVTTVTDKRFTDPLPLDKWIWAALILIFCLERYVALKSKKEEAAHG